MRQTAWSRTLESKSHVVIMGKGPARDELRQRREGAYPIQGNRFGEKGKNITETNAQD